MNRICFVLLGAMMVAINATAEPMDDCLHGNRDTTIQACTKALSGPGTQEIRMAEPGTRALFLSSRGHAYTLKGEYAFALADLNEAVRLFRESPKPHKLTFANTLYDRGIVYSAKGEHDQAIIDISETIDLNPEDPVAFASRGMIFAKEKRDFDRAIADFDEALRRDPRNAYALAGRGLAYLAKGASERASADLNAAERFNPSVKRWVEQHWHSTDELKNQ